MLATPALFVVGASALIFRRRRTQGAELGVDGAIIGRDIGSFLAFFALAAAAGLVNLPFFVKVGVALLQVEKIEAQGVEVAGAEVRMGSPVDQILNAADEIGAGLVVVGRRGLGGVRRLLMGHVSEGIVHNARCPVLVLRGGEAPGPPRA